MGEYEAMFMANNPRYTFSSLRVYEEAAGCMQFMWSTIVIDQCKVEYREYLPVKIGLIIFHFRYDQPNF